MCVSRILRRSAQLYNNILQEQFSFSWQPSDRVPNQETSSELKNQVQQVRFNKSVPPLAAHEPTPMELFLYHSQATTCARGAGESSENYILLYTPEVLYRYLRAIRRIPLKPLVCGRASII